MAEDIFSGERSRRDWSCGADPSDRPRVVTGAERWSPAQLATLAKTIDAEVETNGRLVLKRAGERSLPAQDQQAWARFFRAWRFFRDGLKTEPRTVGKVHGELARWRSENAEWTKRLSTPTSELVRASGDKPIGPTAPPEVPGRKQWIAGTLAMAGFGLVGFLAGREWVRGSWMH